MRAILSDWRAAVVDETPATCQARLRSPLEARLLALISADGLPMPLCNRKVEVGGKHLEVDFLWPEQRLVVETDGRRYHDNPSAFERDRLRDRALHLSGYRVVRVTWAQIEREPSALVSAIGKLLVVDR